MQELHGCHVFSAHVLQLCRFADRDHSNIVRWNMYDRGSHFSPHDAGDLLLNDIREFYQPLR